MKSRWSDADAAAHLEQHGAQWGEDVALRTYTARLIGGEPALVLHGGGNTSVKTTYRNRLGEEIPAICVKASGCDLATIAPEGHLCIDLEHLRRLRSLADLTDTEQQDEMRTHMLRPGAAVPSMEALLHAFLPMKWIDHTHADSILALANQAGGERLIRDALGDAVIVVDYVKPGFHLAKAVADAYESRPGARGMVLLHHGLVTWGETPRSSYEATIEFVTKAEVFLQDAVRAGGTGRVIGRGSGPPIETARERMEMVAPILRGLLAERTASADRPFRRVILRSLIDREILDFVANDRGRALALSSPVTTDNLIRTKPFPLWIDDPAYGDPDALREQLRRAVEGYAAEYSAYVERHSSRLGTEILHFDPRPRVVFLPGLGAICAGRDAREGDVARDITSHTVAVKSAVTSMGEYQGLAEEHLFDMEHRILQNAKLSREMTTPLGGTVAMVTGAAGAIGGGICRELLESGCHVAATDLPGAGLDEVVAELREAHPGRIIGVPIDVTEADSIARGFAETIRTWGGIDLIIANAGVAHASSIQEMEVDALRRLEKVNVDGTLLLLQAAARHFERQGTGGDIVLISTKNVFSPGAGFGAYSATKAAAHQLARIASQEMAPLDVRVNMVAPDAVFSDGDRKSGLWLEVGPERMRARGLDEAGLEEYYRQRNLLKMRVTARHVARAVLFFATRQTPTTGATIPVDGGLPDSTPR